MSGIHADSITLITGEKLYDVYFSACEDHYKEFLRVTTADGTQKRMISKAAIAVIDSYSI